MGAITSTGGTEKAGDIKFHAANALPSGWLKANGAAVSRAAYGALFTVIGTTYGAGDGATTFNLPDLRGEFLRGFDDGRGVDSGRVFGTVQGSQMASHTHAFSVIIGNDYPAADINSTIGGGVGSKETGAAGGTSNASETRPRNVAMMPCIKF